MKAILKYDLPEEREEYDIAMHGVDYMLVLHDLSNFLRSKTKYNPENESDEAMEIYDKVREELYRLLNSHGVEI